MENINLIVYIYHYFHSSHFNMNYKNQNLTYLYLYNFDTNKKLKCNSAQKLLISLNNIRNCLKHIKYYHINLLNIINSFFLNHIFHNYLLYIHLVHLHIHHHLDSKFSSIFMLMLCHSFLNNKLYYFLLYNNYYLYNFHI